MYREKRTIVDLILTHKQQLLSRFGELLEVEMKQVPVRWRHFVGYAFETRHSTENVWLI